MLNYFIGPGDPIALPPRRLREADQGPPDLIPPGQPPEHVPVVATVRGHEQLGAGQPARPSVDQRLDDPVLRAVQSPRPLDQGPRRLEGCVRDLEGAIERVFESDRAIVPDYQVAPRAR